MIQKAKEWSGVVALVATILVLALFGGGQKGGESVPVKSENSSKELGNYGTRFPNGIALGAGTSVTNVGGFDSGVATTTAGGSTGNVAYSVQGNIDYAYVEVDLTATSSVPGMISNPFGNATSTILGCGVNVTSNGIAVSQSMDISTTSSTVGGYGSSTPALMSNFVTGAGQFYASCYQNSATTTMATAVQFGVRSGLLPGMTTAGASNWILSPNEVVTARIASTSPGTFGSYWTGKFWLWVMKP